MNLDGLLNFVNKNIIPNFVKSFRYISCVKDLNWFVHESFMRDRY